MTRTNGRFLILLLGFAAYSGLFVASLASGIPLGTVLICERQLIYPNPPICAAVRSVMLVPSVTIMFVIAVALLWNQIRSAPDR